jgi:hypothetical protein
LAIQIGKVHDLTRFRTSLLAIAVDLRVGVVELVFQGVVVALDKFLQLNV